MEKCQASVFLGREKNVIQSSISSISTVMQSAASSTKIAQQLFEIFLDKMRKKDEVFIIMKNDFLLSTYAVYKFRLKFCNVLLGNFPRVFN